MNNDAVSSVIIMNREYPLKFSVKAAHEIKSRFGDVDKATDGLTGSADTLDKLNYAIALVAILATQGARAHNFEHPEEPPIPDLTEEIAETVLTINDLNIVIPAIIKAIHDGVGREVISTEENNDSDDSEKNSAGV